MTTALTIPDLGPLVPDAERVCQQIDQTIITTPQEYTDLQHAGNLCKALMKEIEAECKEIVENSKAAYDAAKAFRAKYIDPLKAAMDIASRKTGQWAVAQRRLTAIAAAVETARRQRQAEDEQFTHAAALEQAGHPEIAQAVLEQPVVVSSVRLPQVAAPPVAGSSIRTYWKARRACGHELEAKPLPCCVEHDAKIPREYMQPAASLIGAYGRQWGEAAVIPGVEFFPDHKSGYSGKGI